MTERTASGDGFEEPEGTSLVSATLDYAAKGWRVFPLHSPTSEGCSCENLRRTKLGSTRERRMDSRTPLRTRKSFIDGGRIGPGPIINPRNKRLSFG
jgi:hypothetical protein